MIKDIYVVSPKHLLKNITSSSFNLQTQNILLINKRKKGRSSNSLVTIYL